MDSSSYVLLAADKGGKGFGCVFGTSSHAEFVMCRASRHVKVTHIPNFASLVIPIAKSVQHIHP